MADYNETQQIDILNDICTITTIPTASLQQLFDIGSLCIANSIYEAYLSKQEYVELDVGFGTLVIGFENNTINYKFIPTKKLEKQTLDAIRNNKDPLANKIEKCFVERILKTYKDMF